ncbi:SSI family serine proteinase inhibitor [Streptomyces hoynatensis]|uniref:Subtilisin inhibitor domain-containing protein n=1 Tax=Streptomyces hoynatensis TaxID=1141874 RepID=A0A3A9YPK1_9ACTN|nr:SSI family serine proteinase inhibitor [Streptomyces hoynatensis]RKN37988.1 hypothetical protein D7294_25695 [Streptomyces hoynatensis]
MLRKSLVAAFVLAAASAVSAALPPAAAGAPAERAPAERAPAERAPVGGSPAERAPANDARDGGSDARDGDPAEAGTHRLTITVTGAGDADGTFVLTCSPAGGDHPQSQAACDTLREAAEPFAAQDEDALCTYMYGGPAEATIRGLWAGEQVDAHYSRANGCEIARWDALVPALPELGGQTA